MMAESRIRKHLLDIAKQMPTSPDNLSKQRIRKLHSGKRLSILASMNGSFDYYLSLLYEHLARPREIEISKIDPYLSVVAGNDAHLFNAASLLWSVPVSKGFGRRMRYLVRDKNNGKLIGLIGLTDPVFNLTPRDAWIGWNAGERAERLVYVMNAFVLGALPPYRKILGGKLVALLAASREVVTEFRRKYRGYEGVISKSKKAPHLVLITTSSALGRSSIYNRLCLPKGIKYLTGVDIARVPTWYTCGYGHFHIPEDIFAELQNVLLRRNHPYAKGNEFGNGPNWRIRVIRQAAVELGVKAEVVQHGICRQVYVVPLADNTCDILLGKAQRPIYITKTTAETADYWRERWAIPRAQRHPEWKNWNIGGTISNLRRLRLIAERMG